MQTVVGVVPGVAEKTIVWLVVATMAEVRRRKWPKWWLGGGKEKLGKEMGFSQIWLLIPPSSGHEIHPYL